MIDLRSDTVTRPTPAMRQAMAEAEVGDDVLGDDPTVLRLQELAAEMVGKEAALYVPSGTQGNLVSIMAHCDRGDEFVVGQAAHTYRYEAGGAAVLGSIQPQPLDFEPDGTLDLDQVASSVKPPDHHFARTRLLCLENTQGGKALPLAYMAEAAERARDLGLALHLDGARVFNAAVASGVDVTEITRHVDTVSFCLSKGLGAPVGSLVAGPADFVDDAHRWRKMTGGGMRQAGILAAAGIVALTNHVDRLADDHANAARLAEGLAAMPGIEVDHHPAQTNMVFAEIAGGRGPALAAHLDQRGVRVVPGDVMRLVTHLDVSADDIEAVLAEVASFSVAA